MMAAPKRRRLGGGDEPSKNNQIREILERFFKCPVTNLRIIKKKKQTEIYL